MAEGQHTRRPDVVPFVNGLPLVVIELENPADKRKEALATYTESGGAGKTALDQAVAVAVMLEKAEVLSEAWATA